jgi:hypothetical protein
MQIIKSIAFLMLLGSISIVHGQNNFDIIGLKSAMLEQSVFRAELKSCDSLPKNLAKEEYFKKSFDCAYQYHAVFTILEAFLSYSDSTLLSIDEFHLFIDFSNKLGIIGFNSQIIAFEYDIEAICIDSKPRNYTEVVNDFERFVVLFNWVELKNIKFWNNAFDIFFNNAPSISIHDESTKTVLRHITGLNFFIENDGIICRSKNWYQ